VNHYGEDGNKKGETIHNFWGDLDYYEEE